MKAKHTYGIIINGLIERDTGHSHVGPRLFAAEADGGTASPYGLWAYMLCYTGALTQINRYRPPTMGSLSDVSTAGRSVIFVNE